MFTFLTIDAPKTSEEARRQAETLSRAAAMVSEIQQGGAYKSYAVGAMEFDLYKSNGEQADTCYQVSLGAMPSCTCEDFKSRGKYCKHIMAIGLVIEAEYEDAQAERLEELVYCRDAYGM